jgi:serine/threonine protein phosphatase PrpC
MLSSLPAILPRFDFRVEFAVANDIGARREHNEDAFVLAPEFALFAVADGMGGHRAGEVAARLAVEEVRSQLASRSSQRVLEKYVTHPDLESRRAVFGCLRSAFEHANARVRKDAGENADHAGMGTTLDVVWLARDSAFIGHAGDGRVYLARSRATLQLTQDHTSTATLHAGTAASAAARSGVTNAVGISDAISVDTLFVDVSRGDRLLLCSDGIHGQVESESVLAELLRQGDAAAASRALVTRVGEHGRDNATAIVIEIGERFVRRNDRDRGLVASDLERARQSPLLVDLPESAALSALAAAVEVEVTGGEVVTRVVANDLVAYIVLDGVVRYPTLGRSVGAGALIFPESLVGVAGQGEPPVADQTARLLRVRADDFAEVCKDARLAAELYRRLAAHIARLAQRPESRSRT